MTASTVTSGPANVWSRAANAAWSVPGKVRTSTSAVPLPGMTLTLFPTWITVGVMVSWSMAANERRSARSATRRSRSGSGARRVTGGEVGDLAEVQRRKERPDDRRWLAARRRFGQAGDRSGKPGGRVLGVGHAPVAGCPCCREPRPDDPLLGDLDRVHPPVADRHRIAADLVEGRGREVRRPMRTGRAGHRPSAVRRGRHRPPRPPPRRRSRRAGGGHRTAASRR